MNIYISTDLEGVCGVYTFQQSSDYNSPHNIEARHLQMGEVNACVEGLKQAGVDRVIVGDGHGGPELKNFFLDELHEEAEVIMGKANRGDLDIKYDAVVFLGFHSLSHTPNGTLCHTQSSVTWDNYSINGKLVGELEMCAIGMGSQGIPVILVTGDDKTCKEARDVLGDDVMTLQVKIGLGREGALMFSPKKARKMIEAAAKKAVSLIPKVKPYKIEFPVTVRWMYKDSGIVDSYHGSAKKLDGQTLEKEVNSVGEMHTP